MVATHEPEQVPDGSLHGLGLGVEFFRGGGTFLGVGGVGLGGEEGAGLGARGAGRKEGEMKSGKRKRGNSTAKSAKSAEKGGFKPRNTRNTRTFF